MIRQTKRTVEETVYEEHLECHRCGTHAPKSDPTKASKDPFAYGLEDVPRGAWFAAADKKGWGYCAARPCGTEWAICAMQTFCPPCFATVSAFLAQKVSAAPPPPKVEARPARPAPNPYSRFEVDE